MANLLFGWGNQVDGGTLSGGSWSTTLPLTNLQSRSIAQVARSTDVELASTQFVLDRGDSVPISFVGLVNISCTPVAQWRITADLEGAFTTLLYDSGWLDVYDTLYTFGTLPWGDPHLWNGKLSPDDLSIWTAHTFKAMSSTIAARYWKIEISDVTNGAGYVDIGRVFLGLSWQPETNMEYGFNLGVEDQSEVEIALSGARYFDQRGVYRYAEISLPLMDADEAMGTGLEVLRRQGKTGEVFFVFDPDDTLHKFRRSFLSTIASSSGLEFFMPAYHRTKLRLEEVVP